MKWIRLQGEEWKNKKDNLILIKYYKNQNNHIKGFYKDVFGNKYTHWLNDEEINILNKKEVILCDGSSLETLMEN